MKSTALRALGKFKRTCYAQFVRARAALFRYLLGSTGPRTLINGKPVQHVVSLGTHCLTSALLKRYGHKRYSLPFDWLFFSPVAVQHCIAEDFITFLDASHFYSMSERRVQEGMDPGAHHGFYLDQFGVDSMFAHRDPTKEEDYRYFKSAVVRFRALAASTDTKLFVQIVQPRWDAVATFDDTVRLLEGLTQNAAFLCIQLRPSSNTPGTQFMRCLKQNGLHRLYEFEPASAEQGVRFEDLFDELAVMRLVWQFDLA